MKYDRNDHGDFYIEEPTTEEEGLIDHISGSRIIIIPVEEWKEFYVKVVEHHLQLLKEKKTTPKEDVGITLVGEAPPPPQRAYTLCIGGPIIQKRKQVNRHKLIKTIKVNEVVIDRDEDKWGKYIVVHLRLDGRTHYSSRVPMDERFDNHEDQNLRIRTNDIQTIMEVREFQNMPTTETTLPSGVKVSIGPLDPNDEETVRQWEELKEAGIGPEHPDF